MTENDKAKQNELLNPPSLNLETGEGIRSFLEWLYDPEVDKAFQEAYPIDESEQDDDNETTCNFCSKDWIGYVTMPDNSMPLVCKTHWDIYSTN